MTKSLEQATVNIDSIGAGGEGVGRMDDGRVVFVHRTAPGDLARIRIDHSAKRWARGTLLELQTASEARRPPPCEHFERCGGCTLEHIQYPAQLDIKARIVRDALQRIGGFDVSLPEVVASPEEFHYRNRVSFTLRRLKNGQVVAGFHELGQPNRIVDITDACLLPEPAIAKAWGQLRAAWGDDARFLPGGVKLRLTLRATASGDIALLIEGEKGGGDYDYLMSRIDDLRAIWIDTGAGSRLVAGDPALRENWGDVDLEVSGAAFLQVNRGAALLLESYVLEQAGDVSGKAVVDAYCGAGLHATRLAERGAAVTGIELEPSAVRAARALCGDRAQIVEARVENVLSNHLPADLLIVNPPRGGLEPEATEAIAAQPPAALIYISCDPATLARDLQRIGGAMEMSELRSFDLFPQTAHVESVATLRRVAGDPADRAP